MLNRNVFNFALPMNGKIKYSVFHYCDKGDESTLTPRDFLVYL